MFVFQWYWIRISLGAGVGVQLQVILLKKKKKIHNQVKWYCPKSVHICYIFSDFKVKKEEVQVTTYKQLKHINLNLKCGKGSEFQVYGKKDSFFFKFIYIQDKSGFRGFICFLCFVKGLNTACFQLSMNFLNFEEYHK